MEVGYNDEYVVMRPEDVVACLEVLFEIQSGHCLLTVIKKKNKLHGLSPRANYTDRATAACRRSDCQLCG
jgi:hypothetical protein